MTKKQQIRVGLVGYGYWGPNLARNFYQQPDCVLQVVSDRDPDRRALAESRFPTIDTVAEADELIARDDVDFVLVATPVDTHFEIAKAALQAGKHVLVEKPMTARADQADELVALAQAQGVMLAVDHTFLYTGAVRKMHELIQAGDLGQVHYVDSVRVNLGLIQPDVNVIWDLAPHDFSILAYLFDEPPIRVRAMGNHHRETGLATSAYVHVDFASGLIAHYHVNWLAPVKIRRTLVGGSKQMIVYDDMEPTEKIKLYDKGILVETVWDRDTADRLKVDYRTGDMLAPKLLHREALAVEAEHLLDCIRSGSTPVSDGVLGAKVVHLLEASSRSLEQGEAVKL